MSGDDLPFPIRRRLGGPWRLHPVPLEADPARLVARDVDISSWDEVPEAIHLQLHLYPDRPYWGDHLRKINEQAWIYRRTFHLPDRGFSRVRLLFEGVDYYAQVWLNGIFAGEHEGAFDPFHLDVTDLVHPGENSLAVRVTSPWDPPTPFATNPVDWVLRGMVKGLYEHAEGVIPPNVNPIGIWRPTWLVLDDGMSIESVLIRGRANGTVNVRIEIENATGADRHLTLSLRAICLTHDAPGWEGTLEVNLPPGRHTISHSFRLAEPRLWWPWDQGESPLYRLTVEMRDERGRVHDRHEDEFGLRDVELLRSKARFMYRINGRPVFIRGTSYMPGPYLSAVTEDLLAGDMRLAREANLNLIRVHVHVSPWPLYRLCDRMGIMIWQDFELNWLHEYTVEFERRALRLQRAMIRHLYNHPSIITWSCHNEPTMIAINRHNLLKHPDPALYEDAKVQDPDRPVFICSGQLPFDLKRAGDIHTYYGAFWSAKYTDVYKHPARLNTEFGVETPASAETLRKYPDLWERTRHLEGQIEEMWRYQAELTRYHVEHYRRMRFNPCAGYIHFQLVDLVPQVGCGVLDSERRPKGGYDALKLASRPVHIFLEHDGKRAMAVWAVNDTPESLTGLTASWRVSEGGQIVTEGAVTLDLPENSSRQVTNARRWKLNRDGHYRVELRLVGADGLVVSENVYNDPFHPPQRPKGYPFNYDPYLGTKIFDRPDAQSMVQLANNPLLRPLAPVFIYPVVEWSLRFKWSPALIRIANTILGLLTGR